MHVTDKAGNVRDSYALVVRLSDATVKHWIKHVAQANVTFPLLVLSFFIYFMFTLYAYKLYLFVPHVGWTGYLNVM